MLDRKIILASQSPRRSQLLEQAGFHFEIMTNPVEETYPAELPVEDVAAYLAHKKAVAARHFITGDEIVLAADSIVILGNTIYGKPRDYDDAFNIIRALSGNTHKVITGVCLMSADKERNFSGISKVRMSTLSDSEIDFYIKNYKPYDKAGAYAIQEWIGLCKITRIEGTYSNIMGLPVDLVYKELMAW